MSWSPAEALKSMIVSWPKSPWKRKVSSPDAARQVVVAGAAVDDVLAAVAVDLIVAVVAGQRLLPEPFQMRLPSSLP